MALLYLVTESMRDAVFYRKCAERFGRQTFSWVQDKQYRKGDGSAAVQTHLKYALRQAKAAAGGDETVCFVAAIDNDRSPHPENEVTLQRDRLSEQERNRPARLPWMESVAIEVLGPDRSRWPLRTGFAVPVEMLESWTVKALDAEQSGGPTPHFSWQHQQRAGVYYHPVKAPPQWKDIERDAREAGDHADDEEFYERVVVVISANPQALVAKSRSFRHFHQQLAAW